MYSIEQIKKNIGEIIKYRGDEYKKVETDHSNGCDACVTIHGSELCRIAGDCSGIILHKYRSYIETFKQL